MRNNFSLPLYDVCLFESLIPHFCENVTVPKNDLAKIEIDDSKNPTLSGPATPNRPTILSLHHGRFRRPQRPYLQRSVHPSRERPPLSDQPAQAPAAPRAP